MNKDQIWQKIKEDKTQIYGQSMLDVFLQTTETLRSKHYLELNEKQQSLIKNSNLARNIAYNLYKESKERNAKLEEIIKKDPYAACHYAKEIIQGRWPEAEEYIKEEPEIAYIYAKNVIKGRWPEAEESIKKNDYYYEKYRLHFNLRKN